MQKYSQLLHIVVAHRDKSMGKQANKGPSVHVVMDSHGNKLETFTLHSVRRLPSQIGKRQANVVQPKVYIVEPRGFRHLVQKLTGAPSVAQAPAKGHSGHSLQSVAPPALTLPRPLPVVEPLPEGYESYDDNTLPLLPIHTPSGDKNFPPENFGSSFGFPSPTAHSPWFNFPLLSPGTMASLEQETAI